MEMEFSVGIRDKKSAVELYDKNTNVRGLQDLGQGLSLRDLNLRPLGQCLDPKLQKGNSWRYPRISGPTFVPLLVAQWLGRWCTSLVAQVGFL